MKHDTNIGITGLIPCPACGHSKPINEPCNSLPCRAERRAREEAIREKQLREASQNRRASSESLACFPEVIRETDLSRLSEPLRQCVAAYDPAARRSLLIYGATRTGKTRTAFLIAQEFAAATSRSVEFYTMRTFEGVLMKSFRDKRHDEILDRLCSAPFIVLDDFGKEKITDRIASDLFALIDDRTSNRRPTLITTNLNGAALEDRLSHSDPELAAALVARLREFFTLVHAPEEKE